VEVNVRVSELAFAKKNFRSGGLLKASLSRASRITLPCLPEPFLFFVEQASNFLGKLQESVWVLLDHSLLT
jgi:hypothetical protein